MTPSPADAARAGVPAKPAPDSPAAVIAVVGPTAAGKSSLGLAIAHALGGEVVNADAMQLYRGLDIGTAKLPDSEREGIPHHLLDVWDIARRASVADYQALAVAAVQQLHSRGVVPVVVGGSGLYLSALLEDLHIPPTDPEVRARLEADLAQLGPLNLHARLAALDPPAAQAILASNGRRVVRALEVVELTGSYSASLPDGSYRWPGTVTIGMDAPDLPARIQTRVLAMFEAGLVAETLALEGLAQAPTASKALGYAQVLAEPDNPALAAELTAAATRRYARRQRSWLRRDRRIHWFEPATADRALRLVTRVTVS